MEETVHMTMIDRNTAIGKGGDRKKEGGKQIKK